MLKLDTTEVGKMKKKKKKMMMIPRNDKTLAQFSML